MGYIADITVYDRYDQPVLIVEVKSGIRTSSDWAEKIYRNILAHGFLPKKIKYFLLALPDRFYLWKNIGSKPIVEKPLYEIDPTSFLKPYFEKSGISPDKISENSFELIVASWLREIIQADTFSDSYQHSHKWLFDSGLFQSINSGRVDIEVRV